MVQRLTTLDLHHVFPFHCLHNPTRNPFSAPELQFFVSPFSAPWKNIHASAF